LILLISPVSSAQSTRSTFPDFSSVSNVLLWYVFYTPCLKKHPRCF